jgi:hypothetical protein
MTINAMRSAHNAKVLLSERRVPLSGHSFAVIVRPSHVPPRPASGLKLPDNDLIAIESTEAAIAFKRAVDARFGSVLDANASQITIWFTQTVHD